MKKFLMASVLSLVLATVLPAPVHAFAGGFVDGQLRLTKASSPYKLTSTIQVPAGASVLVEPGVELIVQHPNVVFRSGGKVELLGTAAEKIKIRGAHVLWETAGRFDSKSDFVMTHVEATGLGSLFTTLNQGQNLRVSDSVFSGGRYSGFAAYNWLSFCTDCSMERNVFRWLPGYRFMTFGDGKARVNNNLFIGNSSSGLDNGAWLVTDGNLELVGNSFVQFDKPVIKMNEAKENLILDGNFFDGRQPSAIGEIVARDLSSFRPTLSSPLSAPSPLTPVAPTGIETSNDFSWKFIGNSLQVTTKVVALKDDLVRVHAAQNSFTAESSSVLRGGVIRLNFRNLAGQFRSANTMWIESNNGFGEYQINRTFNSCNAMWNFFDGGIAKASNSRNKGPRNRKSPTVYAVGYDLNASLDRDRDGIVCER